MDTVAKRILAGYRQLLIDGCPSVEGRVYSQRTPRLGHENTPCLSVVFGDESLRPITASFPRVIEHSVEVVVLGYSAAPAASVEEVLEGLAAEVETALAGGWKLGGLVKSLNPTRIRRPDPAAADRDYPQGLIASGYTAIFHTVEGQPAVAR